MNQHSCCLFNHPVNCPNDENCSNMDNSCQVCKDILEQENGGNSLNLQLENYIEPFHCGDPECCF